MAIDDRRFFRRLATGRGSGWASPTRPASGLRPARAARAAGPERGASVGAPPAPAPVRRAAAAAQPPDRPARRPRNIRYHYDLGNELFSLFLDETMTYSCASSSTGTSRSPRRSAASCGWSAGSSSSGPATTCSRSAAAGALRPRRGRGVRRARDRDHPLSRPGRPGAAPRRRGRAGRPRRGPRPGLPRGRGCSRRWPRSRCSRRSARSSSPPSSPRSTACSRPAVAPVSRRSSSPTPATAATAPARTGSSVRLPRLPHPLAGRPGAGCGRAPHSLPEEIGQHYGETLARWREAFVSRLGEVRALGYDERFVRTWDFYLASCEALFRAGLLATPSSW